MKNHLSLFAIIILVFACSEQSDPDLNEGTVISIDISDSLQVPLSELCSELRYVPLITEADYTIGTIDKLIANDSIKIFDTTSPAIFVFDSEGHFENEIPILSGAGPFELEYLSDLAVHPTEDRFYLLGNQKIVSYTYDGEPYEEYPLSILPQKMTLDAEGNYILYFNNSSIGSDNVNSLGHNVVFLSPEGEVLNSLFELEPELGAFRYLPSDNLPLYEDRQLFFSSPDNNIYEISAEGESVRYEIDFGSATLTESELANLGEDTPVNALLNVVFSEGFATLIHNVVETENLVHLNFHTSVEERSSVSLFSKETGRVLTGRGFENDHDNGPVPTVFETNFDDEWIVGELLGEDILSNTDEITSSDVSNLHSLVEESNLSEDDFVLMMCRTKEF